MAKLTITLDGVLVKEYSLDDKRITIGRGSSNNIVLDDETVSGEHAAIQSDNETVITDLRSTNGTFLNGSSISKEPLKHGDVLKIGGYLLTFIDARTQDFTATVILKSPVEITDKSGQGGEVKILNGAQAGEVITISKTRTTIGRPGVQVAVILRNPDNFTLMPIPTGKKKIKITSKLNGATLTNEEHLIDDGDIIEIAGTRLQFTHQKK